MLTVLVGHRGVGKSSLLKRIKTYRPWAQVWDLDAAIEENERLSIVDIFSKYGEEYFRRLENEVFFKIYSRILASSSSQKDNFIALGAGFQFDLPENLRVVHIRRDTDEAGRIFVDRPRLKNGTPLDEWREFFAKREERFRQVSHETFTLPEGLLAPNSIEEAFWNGALNVRGASLTLLPENFKTSQQFASFIAARLKANFRFFELRTDLLGRREIAWALDKVPQHQLLLSFRQEAKERLSPLSGVAYDWDITLGAPPRASKPFILSLHARDANQCIGEVLSSLEAFRDQHELPKETILKCAIKIESFFDLDVAHRWASEAKATRALLPTSCDGRWSWYRKVRPSLSGLNFIREGLGSALDQPTLFEWCSMPEVVDNGMSDFAAVLGYPLTHSFTPMEQSLFFAQKHVPVVRVPLVREEATRETLEILKGLGLRWAAVTSPLKKWAFEMADCRSELCQRFESSNTLEILPTTIRAANTDFEGLRALLFSAQPLGAQIVVWGRGALQPQLEALLPQAYFVSARDGVPAGDPLHHLNPDTLIVAGGSELTPSPPPKWRPRKIIDLSYRQDSLGLKWAQMWRCEYISGIQLFTRQAELQRQFWSTTYGSGEPLW